MSTADVALAKAAELKKKSKPAAKKSNSKKPTRTRSDVPWSKVASLYESGKTTAEISDTLGLTRKKTRDGKENPYPYYLVVGYLTKLSHGVEVDGKTIKIKRGGRSKKASK